MRGLLVYRDSVQPAVDRSVSRNLPTNGQDRHRIWTIVALVCHRHRTGRSVSHSFHLLRFVFALVF